MDAPRRTPRWIRSSALLCGAFLLAATLWTAVNVDPGWIAGAAAKGVFTVLPRGACWDPGLPLDQHRPWRLGRGEEVAAGRPWGPTVGAWAGELAAEPAPWPPLLAWQAVALLVLGAVVLHAGCCLLVLR